MSPPGQIAESYAPGSANWVPAISPLPQAASQAGRMAWNAAANGSSTV